MKPDYPDIVSRLGDPLWWDEHGVPRYEAFTPEMCDVYAKYVALLEIACQDCGRRFLVAKTLSQVDFLTRGFGESDMPCAGGPGLFHYCDPPRHTCVGDTMNCDDLRVVEFWLRDGGPAGCEWTRHPEYEVTFEEDEYVPDSP